MVVNGVTIKGNPDADEWVEEYKFAYRLEGDIMRYYVEPFGLVKVTFVKRTIVSKEVNVKLLLNTCYEFWISFRLRWLWG